MKPFFENKINSSQKLKQNQNPQIYYIPNKQKNQLQKQSKSDNSSIRSNASSLKISDKVKSQIMNQSKIKRKNENNIAYTLIGQTNSKKSDKNNVKSAQNQENTEYSKKSGGFVKKTVNYFKNKLTHKQTNFKCNICQCEFQQNKKVSLGKCNHYFCQQCLNQYIKYKISVMEQISCPDIDCQQLLQVKSSCFLTLDLNLQKRYKKFLLFQKISKTQNLKLCPFQQCEEGVVNIKLIKPICDKCKTIFCKKCLQKDHQGPCKGEQNKYARQKWGYIQCKKCKTMIQKSQGCNYIKCKCGFRLCYLCGGQMKINHSCKNGQQIPPQPSCCVSKFGNCPCAIKWVIKPLLFILVPIAIILLLIQIFFVLFTYILEAICYGIFIAPCTFFQKTESVFIRILLVVFLPITMIIGIGYRFYDTFLILIDQMWFYLYDTTRLMLVNIWEF